MHPVAEEFALAMFGLLALVLVSACAAGNHQTCADGQDLAATFTGNPGYLGGQCPGDPEDRISLSAKRASLFGVCPAGKAPVFKLQPDGRYKAECVTP